MTSHLKESLYTGSVMHKRVKPFTHELRYNVFSLLLDLDRLDTLKERYKIFSYNRFNLFSFYDKDHGHRDGSPLKPWVVKHALEKGVDISQGKIYLLCVPRLLGYVFNPISIYFCLDKENHLKAILYEVKNTMGDQLGYFHAIDEDKSERESNGFLEHQNKKGFYVSPFISMDAEYFFKIKPPKEKFRLIIEEHEENSPVLFAEWKGEQQELNQKTLLRQFFTFPFLTFKVIAGIHWHALLLWLKGAKFHKHSPAPKRDVQ